MPTDPPVRQPEDPGNQPSFYRLAWTFYLLIAIAGVIWIGSSQDSIPFGLFLDTKSWWLDIALGLLAGVGLIGLWSGGCHLVPSMRQLEEVLSEHIGRLDDSEAIVLALISGFAEELFFRGAMQMNWGWVWATAIFTLMHSGPGRVFRWWTLFAFLAALLFAGLTAYRGNLLSAIVAHSVVNTVNLRRLAAIAATRP